MPETSSASIPMRAGGRATEAGMAFQAAVATWFAVHILVRQPVGSRFGINHSALPTAIRLETGEGLDDIEVTQSDGGSLHIQCKTTATLGTGERAPLTKTLGQLAHWVADNVSAGSVPDTTRDVAVLAVRDDAARTLDDLEDGCRAFDLGGSWRSTLSQRNQAERRALAAFEDIIGPAWATHHGIAPNDDQLATMARLFRIARFAMDEGGSDWREASRLLGRLIYGNESAGEAPLRDLKAIMRALIESGAPADRLGLLSALRRRGHQDVSAPGYEQDLARLRTATDAELSRLAVHGRLPLGGGIPLARESHAPLLAAVRAGSLLVVGEPGAGKTGALVHAAEAAREDGDSVVFLSVDRFPGVALMADLATELMLTHSVAEVLAAMPGAGRKILFIDALDAARGGPSEGVFASLIEELLARPASDWIVVASIRTFDLKNGRRFSRAFVGAPADALHSESGLSTVRHFLVPRLSAADLALAGSAHAQLGRLLTSAPPRLAALLSNVFNLSLAAELLAGGTDPSRFGEIGTQSGLIDAYEDARLNTTPLQQAAASAAATMAERRRLVVRKVAIGHPALDGVIQAGVLAETGDLVSFAHHVLFDHVAGRFYLAWDDPETLIAQLVGSTSTALLLAPALRFAIERLWRIDEAGRPLTWRLLVAAFSAESVDPVIANVGLRIAAENVRENIDLAELLTRVAASPSDAAVAEMLGRLARFASMNVIAERSVSRERAIAWGTLADALLSTGERALLYPARVLLQMLFEHADLVDPKTLNIFGRASRALLENAWTSSPPNTSVSSTAIRFVGKSFASDVAASRALLDRILREPHFSLYADREATWLAEQIRPITRSDPEFAVEVYAALYGQTITDDATTHIGGQPSRIMGLLSKRSQDYEHCRWQLGTAMGDVLAISPGYGTRALVDALIGKSAARGYSGLRDPELVDIGAARIEFRGYDLEFRAWDQPNEERGSRDDDLLRHFVQFLRSCSVPDFEACVSAASQGYATGAVWTRILGVGAERVAEVENLLWPLVQLPDLLESEMTLRDAVRFVAAAWPTRSREERIQFETMALDNSRFSSADELRRWRNIMGRLLALIPKELLELNAMRSLRDQLETERLLSENRPLRSSTARWGEPGNYVQRELRQAGIDTNAEPYRSLLRASERLNDRVQKTPTGSSQSQLAKIWASAMTLIGLLDSSSGLHDLAERSSWGHVSNAVERVASSKNYLPGRSGLPDLPAMFAVLQRMSASRYPQPRDVEE